MIKDKKVTDTFITGIIGSPHGLKGHVKVRSMSGETDHLLKLREAVVSKDGKDKIYKIEEAVPSKLGVLMRFAGINSPEEAKTLGGAQLLIGRDEAAPLGEGAFYIEDLKGLEVITENDEIIGYIIDVIEGGGGELAEIQLGNLKYAGEKKFVPFRKEFFKEINPEKGRVILKNLWILE